MPTVIAPPTAGRRRPAWDRPWVIISGGLLLAGGLLTAYAGTFHVPFLLDDVDPIEKNPTLRSFATALFPPTNSGVTVSGRPLLSLSFALNQRLGGGGVAGYHLGNLLIHFAAALCLFGLVRRTFQQPALAKRFGAHATPLAWLGAARCNSIPTTTPPGRIWPSSPPSCAARPLPDPEVWPGGGRPRAAPTYHRSSATTARHGPPVPRGTRARACF